MRVIISLLFLTLVVSPHLGAAAPNTTVPQESVYLKADSDPDLYGIKPQEHRNSVFNVSVGYSGGNYLESSQYQKGVSLSLRYIPLTADVIDWDYEATIHESNLVGLAIGRRWYCCPEDPYLPYLRLSANLILKGTDELAGIAEIRRWRARASAGIGEVFISEFGLGYAVTGPDLFALFGFNF